MTLLVFGSTGQVAQALRRAKPEARFAGRDHLDLGKPETIAAYIDSIAPTRVINAAAYTAVDQAETDEALATRINGDAPGAMAVACARLGVPFVHISTDYVFDGSGQVPWQPADRTAPLGAYGRSKLAGEHAVRAAGGAAVILRTSSVFSPDGTNFVKTMIRLGASRDTLNVVADQIMGPTPASAIAAACLSIAEQLEKDPNKAGTYHFCGQPAVSWAAFARAIFAISGQRVTVTDIPGSDYPTPAERPSNSRLDCATLTQQFGITPPDWKAALRSDVARILQETAQ